MVFNKYCITLICILAVMAVSAGAEGPRIVSLAPSITQSLYELGLDSSVVGITAYCPKGAAPKTVIGTLWEPNLEIIVALKPGLVIASKDGNKKAGVEKMKQLGLNVMVIEAPRSFDEVCAGALSLGASLGKADQAGAVVASARRRVEAVRARRGSTPARQTVFWEVGARPLFTVGAGSFMNDYNRYLNTVNIFNDVRTPYPQISREEVLRRKPDVIFVIAMAGVSAQEKLTWQKYPAIPAIKNRRIHFIANQDYFVPTPLNFAAGAEYFEQLLNDTPR